MGEVIRPRSPHPGHHELSPERTGSQRAVTFVPGRVKISMSFSNRKDTFKAILLSRKLESE